MEIISPVFENATLADLPEFGVAHATNQDAMTGCTAFVARGECADGVACGVDVRGGAPATRETDLLKPENMVQKVNAVMIGGGSAFGLEAACGAMDALAENGFGFELGGAHVPIVPAACLFDLLIGESEWPDKEMGAEAARKALEFDASGSPLPQGSVGAGTGATFNKMGPLEAIRKGGFGYSGLRIGELAVMSFVAVNALGDVVENAHGSDGLQSLASIVAEMTGSRNPSTKAASDGSLEPPLSSSPVSDQQICTNTTLGVVLTNASLDKAQATKVSQMAQDAYARCIVPAHTPNDGDTIFTMASGALCDRTVPEVASAMSDVTLVGMLATAAMEEAIHSAVKHA